MDQGLYRRCFVFCLLIPLNLLTCVKSLEILKSSEFEDKEIPLLLNWKGGKHEDGVLEDSGTEKGHTLLFKRSILPFKSDIHPLRFLFKRELNRNLSHKKRWITSGFGLGNTNKSRKDSKQRHHDLQPNITQYIRTPSEAVNSLDGRVELNEGKKQTPYECSNEFLKIHSKCSQPDKKKIDRTKTRFLLQRTQNPLVKSVSNIILYTRKSKIDPHVRNQFTTETIFDRILEQSTELRHCPFKFKFPHEGTHRSAIVYQPKHIMEIPKNIKPVESLIGQLANESPSIIELNKSSKSIGTSDFLPNSAGIISAKKDNNANNEKTYLRLINPRVIGKMSGTWSKTCHKEYCNTHDPNNQIASGNSIGSFEKKNYKAAEKEIGGIILPDTQDNEEPIVENVAQRSPSKLHQKFSKNHTHQPSVSFHTRNPPSEFGKNHNYCGGAGNPYCGGGINISILMPSNASPSTTEFFSSSAYISDKQKKKKERRKKIPKNAERKLFMISQMNGHPAQRRCSSDHTNDDTSLFISESTKNINIKSKSHFRDSRPTLSDASKMIWLDYPNHSLTTTRINSHILYDINTIPSDPDITTLKIQTVRSSLKGENDEDEIRELYDEQNSSKKVVFHTISTESYWPLFTSSAILAKNSFTSKHNGLNSSVRRWSFFQSRKNTPDKKISVSSKDEFTTSTSRKPKLALPKVHAKFENENSHRVEYKFSGDMGDNIHEHFKRMNSYPIDSMRENNNIQSKKIFNFNDGVSYDQWESLDGNLLHGLTGCVHSLNLQARNKKREIEKEDSIDGVQGYYSLSSAISLKHPTNFIISAIRRGKNRDDQFLAVKKSLAEGNQSTYRSTEIADFQNTGAGIASQKEDETDSFKIR